MNPFRIGTRASRLALWQANFVAARLRPILGDRPVVLVEISTSGDQVRDVPLAQLGGQGAFTKEIQRALLKNTIDAAVHSLKDLPTEPVEGLLLAAVPPRGPTADVLISQRYRTLGHLPTGATVATSSLRRRAQLLHRRPDLKVVSIRGNVETRLRKLENDSLDAIVLALAGLERLGLRGEVTEILDSEWMLPAIGQGALGLECRADDKRSLAAVRQLDDEPTHQAVRAERALLHTLGGGCQIPVGAVCSVVGHSLSLRGVVLDPDGRQRIEGSSAGSASLAEDLGRDLALDLLNRGAKDLLRAHQA